MSMFWMIFEFGSYEWPHSSLRTNGGEGSRRRESRAAVQGTHSDGVLPAGLSDPGTSASLALCPISFNLA